MSGPPRRSPGEDAEADRFKSALRNDAMLYDAADTDGDKRLNFDEFSAMVREREVGVFSEEALRARFADLDTDGSGMVELHEYIKFGLKDALARSSARVMDLFIDWDEDGSGTIDRREFRRAVRSFGFDATAKQIDSVFMDFDLDGSGKLDYKELNKTLRQRSKLQQSLLDGAVPIETETIVKHALRSEAGGRRGAAFGVTVKLKPTSDKTVIEQLREMLAENCVRAMETCCTPALLSTDARWVGCRTAPRRPPPPPCTVNGREMWWAERGEACAAAPWCPATNTGARGCSGQRQKEGTDSARVPSSAPERVWEPWPV